MGDAADFFLEISRRTLALRSRMAGGWQMEWKETRGMRWGFPRKISVGPGIGEVEGCMVGKHGWTPAQICDPGFC